MIPVFEMNDTHTAAYKLFHYNYRAWIPQYATYTPEYLQLFGVATSGDKSVDRALANAEMLCQMTISEMAEHLDNGVNITLETPKQSVEIYTIIKQHLSDWSLAIQNNIAEHHVPIEDLKKLDRLAAEVFKVARHYTKERPTGSSFYDRLSQLSRRTPMERPNKVTKEPPKEHTPVTTDMIQNLLSKQRSWRQ